MRKWLAIIIAALLVFGVTAWAEPAKTAEATAEPEETASPEPADDADAAAGEGEAPAPDAAELPDPEAVEALATEEPAAEPVELWFEEGFGLSLPGDWVSYPVSAEDQASGLRYALGDGTGEHFLFIQLTPTELRDSAALSEAVDAEEAFSKRGALTFNGTEFTTFIDTEANASCCAAIWGDKLLIFLFTPQTDADFMLVAPQIMETFAVH